MSETIESLVGRVQQRVGMLPDYFLVQDWLNSAFEDLVTRREWSWRRRSAEALFHAAYATGTVTIVRGEDQATFSGATLTQDMVGRQLRMGGNAYPIRTITNIAGSVATIDRPWGAAGLTAKTFEIYQAYITMPDDFDAFLVIADPERQFRLDFWSWTAHDLEGRDPQRSYSGNLATHVVLRDLATDSLGVVGTVIAARGTGNQPISGGTYTGATDAIYTIEMTSATVFKWKKASGSYTTGVTIDSAGIPQDLSDGVQIAFPTGVAYTNGDVFSVSAKALASAGQARYEFWPHIKADECRPYLYLATPPQLVDPGMIVPRYVNPQYLLQKALAACAQWKHEENKYYDLKLSMIHEGRAEEIAIRMEREDQARETTDVNYDAWGNYPVYNSAYLASHDVGYELNVLD